MYVSGLQSLDVALNRGARLPLLLWLMGITKYHLIQSSVVSDRPVVSRVT